MRPETRAARLIEAGTLPAQWQLLTTWRKAYASHLVSDYRTPVRIAIQRAYIFGFDAYAYDYRSGETVRDQWTHRRHTGRHYYAVRYAYRDAMSDSDALVRFDTYEARRVFCEADENAEPVRIADVRHRFNVHEFNRIAGSDEPAEVFQRPGYVL